MKIETFQCKPSREWWCCLRNHPAFALLTLLIPAVGAWASCQALWKRGVPSAGATAWWSVLVVFHWTMTTWPPSGALLIVVVRIVMFCLTADPAMTHHHWTTLLWLLCGGLHLTLFVAKDPSVLLMLVLFASSMILRHVPAILTWWIVLVHVTQDMLVENWDVNWGWATMVSVLGVVGTAHAVHEHGGLTMQ